MSQGAAAPLLEVRQLSVILEPHSGPRFEAVSGVSFALRPGETFCLVGESGCGKSMTALAVMGLVPPVARVSGEILFEGKNLVGCPERELSRVRGRRIGMVFQEPMTSLNPVLRVGLQVSEVLEWHLGLSRREAMARTTELFRMVGIPSPERRVEDYPCQLSGGLRQRVMIAMAMACGPRLILADEPTTALDVTMQGQILSLLRDLGTTMGTGLLLITHDLGVVAAMADTVGVMYAGCMVEKAPAGALLGKPLHPYTQGLMRSMPTLEHLGKVQLDTIPGAVPQPGNRPEGCLFAPRCPRASARCAQRPPSIQTDGREVSCWLYADG
ncbi:MAG: ABC transporter ATP-binding protein [Deltaproteobacteria bacterium]|nr:ABC transporter ATP-binding protein [Deltaproteobacteria bacterium]